MDEQEYTPIPLKNRVSFPEEEMIQRSEDFYELMKKRRTIRDFSPEMVPQSVIENAILTAGLAPNGANKQPWHFAVIGNETEAQKNKRSVIRSAAEEEEERFYGGKAGQEWLETLKPLGTDSSKPFLEIAPWLIVVFARRYDLKEDGTKLKNYYVPESVGISCGLLVTALHNAGVQSLTHTPSPMGFLNELCDRPEQEKALMIVVAGYARDDATVPAEALNKKPLDKVASFL